MLYQALSKSFSIRGKQNPLQDTYWLNRNRQGSYHLDALGKLPKGPIDLYIGTQAQKMEHQNPLYQHVSLPLQIRGLDIRQRHYFEMSGPGIPSQIIAQRKLPMRGTHNFRDLGGYFTEEGSQVVWGTLFRSDHLFGLQNRDWKQLQAWGIAHICDMRGPEERKSKPDRIPPDIPIHYHSLPVFDPSQSLKDFLRMLRKARPENFDGEAYMQASYRRFVHEFSGPFARFLALVVATEGQGLLVHCTGGKDRTGLASALLLKILGVSEKTIREDYLASNYFRYQENQSILRKAYFLGVSLPVIIPILEVRESYLEAAFEEIKLQYGSFSHFLEQKLGILPSDVALLRKRFLRAKP